jgi:hypothetical protein
VTLPHALKQHFADLELSDDQLAQLAALQQRLQLERQTDQSQDQKQDRCNKQGWGTALRSRLQPYRYQLVTAMVVVLTIAVTTPFIGSEDVTRQVIDEVAYNHNKQMTMEVKSANLAEVTNYLSKLGFSLISSKLLPTTKWDLLGGRYCSIHGKLAAQLKVRNREDNRIYTLYQALLPEQMADINQLEDYADGVNVKLWREKGLLLGLAGNPQP